MLTYANICHFYKKVNKGNMLGLLNSAVSQSGIIIKQNSILLIVMRFIEFKGLAILRFNNNRQKIVIFKKFIW